MARDRTVDLGNALFGGAIAAVILFLGLAGVGRVGETEARHLLAASIPTIRFLTSSVITASATILALMLTLLSLSARAEYRFPETHYRRIRLLSAINAVALVAATTTLLFLSMPLEQSEAARGLFNFVYYALTVVSSLLGGLLIAIVLMLHSTIANLVGLLGQADGH